MKSTGKFWSWNTETFSFDVINFLKFILHEYCYLINQLWHTASLKWIVNKWVSFNVYISYVSVVRDKYLKVFITNLISASIVFQTYSWYFLNFYITRRQKTSCSCRTSPGSTSAVILLDTIVLLKYLRYFEVYLIHCSIT